MCYVWDGLTIYCSNEDTNQLQKTVPGKLVDMVTQLRETIRNEETNKIIFDNAIWLEEDKIMI